MREQVGYKLPALLAGRAGLPAETRETCFGDDAEADGFIYSLYGDIIAGRVERRLLEEILERAGTYEDDAQRAVTLAEALPTADAVQRIFIHLDRRSPTVALRSLRRAPGARVQLLPGGDGDVRGRAALGAPPSCAWRSRWSIASATRIDALRNSLQDLLRRGRLRRTTARALADELTDEKIPQLGALPTARELLISFAARVRQLGDVPSMAIALDEPIDYLAALEADLPRKGKKRTDIAPPLR